MISRGLLHDRTARPNWVYRHRRSRRLAASGCLISCGSRRPSHPFHRAGFPSRVASPLENSLVARTSSSSATATRPHEARRCQPVNAPPRTQTRLNRVEVVLKQYVSMNHAQRATNSQTSSTDRRLRHNNYDRGCADRDECRPLCNPVPFARWASHARSHQVRPSRRGARRPDDIRCRRRLRQFAGLTRSSGSDANAIHRPQATRRRRGGCRCQKT